MGWLDFFKKKKAAEPDLLKDLNLSNLKVGYLLDYDMRTWQVEAYHYYDWGNGDITHEWQLKSHDDTIYLQRESDDEAEWSISRPIDFSRLGREVREYITQNEDPPDELVFEETRYYLEEFGGGQFYKDGKGDGSDFLTWDYEDEEGEKYLSIEQWGEEEFEAYQGEPVEEYQFTNILPRESETDT